MLLYGSRAKGNYKNGSDIDLTLIGKNLNPDDSIYPLKEELDKLYLPYTFDISILSKLDKLEFINHILKVGKTFYQKETNELPAGWQQKKLGDVCEISTGRSNTIDAKEKGKFAFFDRSKKIKRSDKFLFDCDAIIIAGEGQKFLPRFYSGKFNLHQRAYAIYNFQKSNNIKYVFNYLMYFHKYFEQG